MLSDEMKIDFNVEGPGPRPKKPSRPRKPQEFFRRTEEIWCSEESDTTLADLLHMIPDGVTADNIRIKVEQNENTGYLYTYITYDHDIPNTKYTEQLKCYEDRQAQYDAEVPVWKEADEGWQCRKSEYDLSLLKLREDIKQAFEDSQIDEQAEPDVI